MNLKDSSGSTTPLTAYDEERFSVVNPPVLLLVDLFGRVEEEEDATAVRFSIDEEQEKTMQSEQTYWKIE